MLTTIITGFSKESKSMLDLNTIPTNELETLFLVNSIKQIQQTLKQIFFWKSEETFLLCQLDKLWGQCESCIATSFKKSIAQDREADWNLVDCNHDSGNPFIGM